MMFNRLGRKPLTLRTDNGTEYVNSDLRNFLKAQGIQHQTTVPHTPQQNGVAERKNRTLTEMTKCMLLDANMPNRFWGEAMLTATYLQNRLPSRSVSKTPYELWHGEKPDIGHIRVFGSKVFSFVPKEKRRKWDNKAEEGLLIGFSDVIKGYRILDPETNRVWVSRTVKIIKKEIYSKRPQISDETLIEVDRCVLEPEGETSDEDESEDIDKSIIQPRISQRMTKGVPPERYGLKVKVEHVREPSSWDEMVKFPEQQRKKWIDAARMR